MLSVTNLQREKSCRSKSLEKSRLFSANPAAGSTQATSAAGIIRRSLDSEDSRCGQLISYKTPDDQIIEAEEHQRLHDSIAHLSAVQQERLLMLADGRSIAEIARFQRAAYNSVKASIRAAQQKIRKIF